MKIYSVSEFNQEVNTLLEELTVCVQGEVSNFHISQERFVWFDLKDKESSLSCFLLSFNLKVALVDGMEIQVIGSPGIFKKSGKFIFKVREIRLVGEGALKRALEELKKKLEKEGLFSLERKRLLPRFPQKIGLITSADAAAYTDVLRILKNRWRGLEIYFYPVPVQGVVAVPQIVEALNYLNKFALEVIILTRGGGSLEELQAFNSEEVARAIFASKIPVVVGVGHERDVTIADLVADKRAATPSNAAELIVPHYEDVFYQITNLIKTQETRLITQISFSREWLNRFANSLDYYLQHKKEKLANLQQLLLSFNPENVLKRGFSITKFKNKILKDSREVEKSAMIETILYKGKLISRTIP